MTLGPVKRRRPGSWKEATAELVRLAGGAEAAAEIVRVGKTQLQRYTDPAEPSYAMPIDVVIALELVVGSPVVTAHMAARQGHLLWRPSDRCDASETIHADYAEIGRALARVMEEYARAITDGRIDPDEAARMLSTVDPAVQALMQVRGELYRMARPDDGQEG